jgi:hypothetical protein
VGISAFGGGLIFFVLSTGGGVALGSGFLGFFSRTGLIICNVLTGSGTATSLTSSTTFFTFFFFSLFGAGVVNSLSNSVDSRMIVAKAAYWSGSSTINSGTFSGDSSLSLKT